MDKLVFFICCLRGLGPRVVQRQNGRSTLTSVHPFIGEQAYRCENIAEFRFLSRTLGKKETFWTEVLLESPSGKFRYPTDTDVFPTTEEPPSPVAESVAPAKGAGMVVPSATTVTGDSLPDRMRAALKKDPTMKVAKLSEHLKVTEEEIRAHIGSTGKPFKMRPYGFIGVIPQPTAPLTALLA